MSNILPASTAGKNQLLSDTMYDKLKFVAQILLPALGALYFGLAAIWGLPAADKVVGTVTTVDVFLGVFLGLSTAIYNKQPLQFDGNLEINEHDSSIVHTLELLTPPEDLAVKTAVVFKVTKNSLSPVSPYPEENLQ